MRDSRSNHPPYCIAPTTVFACRWAQVERRASRASHSFFSFSSGCRGHHILSSRSYLGFTGNTFFLLVLIRAPRATHLHIKLLLEVLVLIQASRTTHFVLLFLIRASRTSYFFLKLLLVLIRTTSSSYDSTPPIVRKSIKHHLTIAPKMHGASCALVPTNNYLHHLASRSSTNHPT